MENLARWFLAQAVGLSLSVGLAMLREAAHGSGGPPDSLDGLFTRFGPQMSILGISLALWPLTDLVFRAAAPDRQWMCGGATCRWVSAALLYLLVFHAALAGLATLAEPAILARLLTPEWLRPFRFVLAGTAFLSAAYAVRLDFVTRRGQIADVGNAAKERTP